ncbi:CBS domain-containing protein [Salipaludibacillus agaradhaerens]|uniref:CBS and ACT domain-containing protein n=1 Tax=Salipaludibacillus agaradhaerens TaxID=76935 RepID=UPI0021511A99|nr:CBS and ACT domain-containing protein [Salipaludibacillus agaradhaerens]MCR6107614.1 CBS domain-containing protein [Salipaludibacillus agaradhaerens]MCR6119643.1 CBS domain-containing protein [Salipaludibacillus agaradhaerens]
MHVRDIMVTKVIVAPPEMSLSKALKLMLLHRIRHLPIVDKHNHLVGIISDRDLSDAIPSIFDSKPKEDVMSLPVSKVMVENVITALPDDFVEEAAHIMTEQQISCLPVEENGSLIGIITETDLLNILVRLTGADLPTSRLEIDVPNETGQLSNVSDVIKRHKINIHSVLVYPSFSNSERQTLVFRIQCMDMRGLISALKEKHYKIVWPQDMGMTQ